MPLTHLRTFRVRHYECDAHGRVRHANYLRYMQETAFDASAAAGYDLARYRAMGRFWLVRETQIEIAHSLRYNDEIVVKTWVADFRQVRSRRAYELRLANSHRLVARGHTDWAFLDSDTERPVAIPAEMKADFFPEGAPASAPARERFPTAPPPPSGAYHARRGVEWQDLDQAGHVNNTVYLAYFEECTAQALAACGWSLNHIAAEGLVLKAGHHHIEYRQPAFLGDDLALSTWISNVQDREAVRHFVITRASDGALITQARTRWALVEDRSEVPVPFPDAFLADLAPSMAVIEL